MNKKKFITVLLGMSTLSFFSKVLGLLRESLLANYYGISGYVDSFKIAYNIPDLLIFMVVSSICHAFIPIYTEVKKEKGNAASDRFTNNILNISVLFSMVLIVLLYLFLDDIIGILAPGFSLEQREVTYKIAVFIIPASIFSVLSYVVSAYLQANSRFSVTSLTWVAHNIVLIGGICLTRGHIVSLGVVTAMAIASMFLVQLPVLSKTKFRYRFIIDFRDEYFVSFSKLIPPILFAGSFEQIYFIIIKIIASTLGEGNISAIDYANRVTTMVYNVIVLAFIAISFVELSNIADDLERFRKTIGELITLINLLLVPIVFFMALARIPILSIIYMRGEFSYEDTLLTGMIFLGLLGTVIGSSFRELLNKAFYALKDTKNPMIIGVVSLGIGSIFSIVISRFLGVMGVALAMSLSSIISMTILIIVLNQKVRFISREFRKTNLTILLSGIGSFAITGLALKYMGLSLMNKVGFYENIKLLVITAMLGGFSYILLLIMTRNKLIRELLHKLKWG